MGLVDGVPKNYDVDTDGEGTALLKLPADSIGAYFSAVGFIFDSIKSSNDSEAEALAASLRLEFEKKKYDTCIAAIKSNDDQRVKDLLCS